MRFVKPAVAVSVLILLLVSSAVAADEPERAAEAAAKSWVTLLDEGKYAQSWEQGSSIFHKGSKQTWVNAVQQIRGRTGKVVSRELVDARQVTPKSESEASKGSNGSFVIVRYRTQFASAPPALEIVTMIKEGDVWKTMGYKMDKVPGDKPAPR